MGSGDLYISWKQADGSWGKSQNLGPEVNSSRMDYCPFVDADGVLYFTSKRIAFPDAPFGIRSTQAMVELTSQFANGQSRLFRVEKPDLKNQTREDKTNEDHQHE